MLASTEPTSLPPPPLHLTAALRRRHVKACRAAATLAPLLSLGQIAEIAATPPIAIIQQPLLTTYHDLIRTLATWSAGYITGAAQTRRRLTTFMLTRRPHYNLGDPVYGQDVVAFLTHVDSTARSEHHVEPKAAAGPSMSWWRHMKHRLAMPKPPPAIFAEPARSRSYGCDTRFRAPSDDGQIHYNGHGDGLLLPKHGR